MLAGKSSLAALCGCSGLVVFRRQKQTTQRSCCCCVVVRALFEGGGAALICCTRLLPARCCIPREKQQQLASSSSSSSMTHCCVPLRTPLQWPASIRSSSAASCSAPKCPLSMVAAAAITQRRMQRVASVILQLGAKLSFSSSRRRRGRISTGCVERRPRRKSVVWFETKTKAIRYLYHRSLITISKLYHHYYNLLIKTLVLNRCKLASCDSLEKDNKQQYNNYQE